MGIRNHIILFLARRERISMRFSKPAASGAAAFFIAATTALAFQAQPTQPDQTNGTLAWLSWIWELPQDWIVWLWSLPGEEHSALIRATVFSLALLMAVLTLADLWQIPPPQDSKPDREEGDGENDAAPAAGVALASFPTRSNLARTALSGLIGLFSVAALQEVLWDDAEINAEAYYIVCFVAWFLTLLFLWAVFRGIAEATRSRLIVESRPPRRTSEGKGLKALPSWTSYWTARFWRWVQSYRPTMLAFLDTFLNVILGRKQLRTEVLEKQMVRLHQRILESIDTTREHIADAILAALENAEDVEAGPDDFRVSISVLSTDERTVQYITTAPGSLPRPFSERSVAWVAVTSGQARWWEEGNEKDERIILYEDGALAAHGTFPAGMLRLKDYFQARQSHDYRAFIVLPIPWRRRGLAPSYRAGAIHVSFRHEAYLRSLWYLPTLEETTPDKLYERSDQVLSLCESSSDDSTGFSRSTGNLAREANDSAKTPKPTPLSSTVSPEKEGSAQKTFPDEPSDANDEHGDAKNAEPWQPPPHACTTGPPCIRSAELRDVLIQSLDILSKLLNGFNEEIYLYHRE